jgi:hypothetical protein
MLQKAAENELIKGLGDDIVAGGSSAYNMLMTPSFL